MIHLLHLGVEISQSYIGLIDFPSSLTRCLLVLAHMLLELTLCGFGWGGSWMEIKIGAPWEIGGEDDGAWGLLLQFR